MAGPAPGLALASLLPYADGLPCPDFGLLGPLKRSPEYAAVRKWVADPRPLDAFLVNAEDHYFVFALKPDSEDPSQSPYAMFTMRYDEDRPILALVITPRAGGREAEAEDIRRPGSVVVVALTPD